VGALIAGGGLQQAFGYLVAAQPQNTRLAVSLSFWGALSLGSVVALVGWIIVGLAVDDAATRSAVRIGLVGLPLSVFGGNLIGVFQGLRLARRFNALRVATPLIYATLLTGVAISSLDLSPDGAMVMHVVASVLGALLAALLLGSRLHFGRPAANFARAAFRYGFVVNLGSIAYTANRYLSLIVLAAVATTEDVGLYSVALGYAIPVGSAALAVALHTLPDVAAAAGQRERAGLARRRLRVAGLTTMPIALAALFVAPAFVPFVFGEAFQDAVHAAQALAIAHALLGMAHVLSEISRGLGRPGLPAVAETVGAVVSLALLAVVVPSYGITGAAITSVGVYALVVVLLLLGLRSALVVEREVDTASQ
jgi:O-antigen/teichoic acid export membrane protein